MDDAIAESLSPLIREELERVKGELKEEFLDPRRRPALFAGSGFAAYMTLLFASIAVWWGLSNVMDQGWAALIVAVVWAAACVLLYLAAKRAPGFGRRKSKPRERTGRHKHDGTIETAWGREPVS
jgi:hypothetical protein